jgi:uncharacterized protein Veg
MLESALVKKIRKKLKTEFGKDLWIFKTHGGADQIRGLPDLIGVYHSYFIAMEVKKPGGQATDLQAFTMQQIRNAGGYASVIHSVEEALDFLGTVPEPPVEATEDRD